MARVAAIEAAGRIVVGIALAGLAATGGVTLSVRRPGSPRAGRAFVEGTETIVLGITSAIVVIRRALQSVMISCQHRVSLNMGDPYILLSGLL